VTKALQHGEWKSARDEEFRALVANKTWYLVSRHEACNIIDYR
jgi:hypothetical protein